MNIQEITGFECCFCRESIIETHTDPCDINIIINSEMKKSSKERSFQNFYSHFECLREKLHKENQGYLVANSPDDDIEAND